MSCYERNTAACHIRHALDPLVCCVRFSSITRDCIARCMPRSGLCPLQHCASCWQTAWSMDPSNSAQQTLDRSFAPFLSACRYTGSRSQCSSDLSYALTECLGVQQDVRGQDGMFLGRNLDQTVENGRCRGKTGQILQTPPSTFALHTPP